MYVEFTSGSSTSVPAADPAEDDYYLKLRANSLSSNDFLRIPIVSVTPIVGDNPNDITLVFNALCVGDEGVKHTSTAGATIYGIALAASPTYGVEIDDLTRDVIWARGYFDTANQIPFSKVSQTLLTFKLKLN
jgi:hypothetical protein